MRTTFLVIDGNAAARETVAAQLRRVSPRAEVIEADSGGEAFRVVDQRGLKPSLIFADFHLPDMNAIELLGALRRRQWLDHTPVAVLGGHVADRTVVDCYRLGARAFLSKPLSTYEIRETVRDFARPAGRGPGPDPSAKALRAA